MRDVELLAAYVREGSQEAFAQLVGKHVDWVYGMSKRLVSDPGLAEDVTQAVFLILARKGESVAAATKTSISGWLFRTCRNCAANALQRRRVRDRHEKKAAAMRSVTEREAKAGVWQELTPVLDSGVAKLGRGDREAVLLRFYEGRTMREVGEAMGTSEEAARKRVGRAVERLRNHFAAEKVVLGTDAGAVLTAVLASKAPSGLTLSVISGSAGATARSIAAGAGWTAGAAAKVAAVIIAAASVGSVIVKQISGTVAPGNGPAAAAGTVYAAIAPSPEVRAPLEEPTAEVIAVGRDPLGENRWWRADGTPLDKSPIEEPLWLDPSEPKPGADAFVIVTREKAPAALTWIRSSFGLFPEPQWTWLPPRVAIRNGAQLESAVAHIVRFKAPWPRAVKPTVGLSKAARYPVAVYERGATDGGTLEAEFEPPTQERSGQALMYMTHNRLGSGEAMSVEVTTADGAINAATVFGSKPAADDRVRSCILIPGGKAEDVKRVRIMAVPMKLIELPAIPLEPRVQGPR